MSALDVADPDTGSKTVLMLDVGAAGAEAEERICFVTGAVNRATLPGIVNRLRMRAIIAIGVDIFPETVKNPKRKENNAAITVVKRVMWHVTVTMQMSRSVTRVEDSDTSRSYATKSNVTGAVRSVTSRYSAAKRQR